MPALPAEAPAREFAGRRVEARTLRANVLGVGVDLVGPGETLAILDSWMVERQRGYVCFAGAHGMIEGRRDPELRRIYNASGLTVADGMPLVWHARLQGHREVRRVYGPDLMLNFCAHSLSKGYRHFLFGGAPGVPEQLREVLTARFPGLRVVGCHSPPFRALSAEEEEATATMINAAAPDIVWVGLGAPKQERWMARNRERLEAPALMGVGAAFDFHAGLKPPIPPWMGRNGLGWLFRLASEPRRLAKRYLDIVPTFLVLSTLQLSGRRSFPLTRAD